MDLVGKFPMLTLLHKIIYKEKHRPQYWVHPLLCTRLEMGPFYALFYQLMKGKHDF
jgi:hypothetical protein